MQDFEELSDYDFEQLVADLLSAEWHARVDSFPRGRDSGVDLRVLGPTSGPLNLAVSDELVVQCKHRPKASIVQLRAELRSEAAKPILGQAERYVLVTSARLTRLNKQEVISIFGGRISERDIFAREDVDALLRRHPHVVQANMKLWLASGTALQAFLNQVEHLRSRSLEVELERLRSTFVETSVVKQARQVLEHFGVCILAGAPGVGKTTTASILLLQYMAEGWQPVVAVSDVRELEAQLAPAAKQVLFFDDFLGQASLTMKLAKGEDQALIRLMRVIEEDSTKVFILTTREYVLRQAQEVYERLTDERFELTKLTVAIGAITAPERAHILYNQLYFSPLRPLAAAAVDGPRRYMAITHHRNYNPRLIDAAISAAVRDLGLRVDRVSDAEPPSRRTGPSWQLAASRGGSLQRDAMDIPDVIKRALDNPRQLWDHVLRHQLNKLQRDLLLVRLSFGSSPVYLNNFKSAGYAFVQAAEVRPTFADIDMALRVLDGDLLVLTDAAAGTRHATVGGLQPGVTDALLDFLRQYPEYISELTASASFFEQVRWLAETLGIFRYRRAKSGQSIDHNLLSQLIWSAERTLMVPSAKVDPWLPAHMSKQFSDFGSRLEVLAAIYSFADVKSSAELAGEVIAAFIRSIENVPASELPRVVRAVQNDAFARWRWRRTELNVRVLAQLGNPTDVASWSLLRDVVDIVEITPEYRQDLEEQFGEFAEEQASNAEEMLDDPDSVAKFDADMSTDDLTELEALADRWGIPSTEIAELADAFRQLARERREAEDQRTSQGRSGQLSLFQSGDLQAPEENKTIFEHL